MRPKNEADDSAVVVQARGYEAKSESAQLGVVDARGEEDVETRPPRHRVAAVSGDSQSYLRQPEQRDNPPLV